MPRLVLSYYILKVILDMKHLQEKLNLERKGREIAVITKFMIRMKMFTNIDIHLPKCLCLRISCEKR